MIERLPNDPAFTRFKCKNHLDWKAPDRTKVWIPSNEAPSWRCTAIVLGGLVVLQSLVNLLAMWIGG